MKFSKIAIPAAIASALLLGSFTPSAFANTGVETVDEYIPATPAETAKKSYGAQNNRQPEPEPGKGKDNRADMNVFDQDTTQVPSRNDKYTPVLPNEETSAEKEEIENYRKDISYESFHRTYFSFNPDIQPTASVGSDLVDGFIKQLEKCSEYSEFGNYCENKNTERYLLGVHTNNITASSFDLLKLAQDIEEKTGKPTLVFTSDHFSQTDIHPRYKKTLMFSDHIDLAYELAKVNIDKEVEKASSNNNQMSDDDFFNMMFYGSLGMLALAIIAAIGMAISNSRR